MKDLFSRKSVLLLLVGLLGLSLLGCWESDLSGNTYVEPEITVDYLINEFANQLTRDGAEKRFGVIDSVKDNKDGTYALTISGKQFVNDSGQPNGFYIADRNIKYELTSSVNARSVIFPTSDLEDGHFYLTSAEFIQGFKEDFSALDKVTSSGEEAYYFYFYVMHDFVELIVEQYVP